MFWNEKEVLYMRLDTLYNYVDKFVICESKESHSKKIIKDEYVFIENKQLYEKFMDKIIFIPIEKLPYEGDTNFTKEGVRINGCRNWKNENYQRKFLFNSITHLENNDIIAFSDVDEIYDPLILETVQNNIDKYKIIGVKHKLFYYYVNALKEQRWDGTFFIKKVNLVSSDTIQNIRDKRTRLPFYISGGWHYSWMGGVVKIQNKFNAVAEHDIIKEFNNVEHIRNTINNISDLFNRKGYNGNINIIDIYKDNNAPVNIKKYIEQFPILFYKS